MSRITVLTVLSLLGASIASAATLSVYPYPATQDIESKLIVPDKFEGSRKAVLSITSPCGKVEKHDVTLESGKAFFTWKAKATGYYKLELSGTDISAVREVPAVWRKMYFYGWVVPKTPQELAKVPVLGSCAVVVGGTPEKYAEYRSYGITPLAFVSFRASQISLKIPENKMVEKMIAKWRKGLDNGADGIWIDELGLYPNYTGLEKNRIFSVALQKMRKLFPNAIIMVANAGTTLREQSAVCKSNNIILCPEVYPDCTSAVFGTFSFEKYLDARINVLRETDMLFERGYKVDATAATFKKGCGIILLGLNNCFGVVEEPFVPKLEGYIRYLKKTAPEMGGLALWSSNGDQAYSEKYIPYTLQNELLERYYVKPVLHLNNAFADVYTPKAKSKVKLICEVANIGGMQLYKPFAVRAFAVDPAGKRSLVGEVRLPGIGVGLKQAALADSKEPVIEHNEGGNKYLVTNRKVLGKNTGLKVINLGRRTITFDFEPKMSGNHRIVFELAAPADVEVINGSLERDLFVR